jgi:hypothetical protein
MELVKCQTLKPLLNNKCGEYTYKRKLIYYPSNSNKGIAIKGTNLRVGF